MTASVQVYGLGRTSDGRVGIVLGGDGGAGRPWRWHLLFEDGTEAQVADAELAPVQHRKVGYDCERGSFRPDGDPVWQDVLRQWFQRNAVVMAMGTLKLAVERLWVPPTCWADEEGLMRILCETSWGHDPAPEKWTRHTSTAVRCAWRLLFGADLPEDMGEVVAAYQEWRAPAWERYSAAQEERWRKQSEDRAQAAALEGTGPPVQPRLPGFDA